MEQSQNTSLVPIANGGTQSLDLFKDASPTNIQLYADKQCEEVTKCAESMHPYSINSLQELDGILELKQTRNFENVFFREEEYKLAKPDIVRNFQEMNADLHKMQNLKRMFNRASQEVSRTISTLLIEIGQWSQNLEHCLKERTIINSNLSQRINESLKELSGKSSVVDDHITTLDSIMDQDYHKTIRNMFFPDNNNLSLINTLANGSPNMTILETRMNEITNDINNNLLKKQKNDEIIIVKNTIIKQEEEKITAIQRNIEFNNLEIEVCRQGKTTSRDAFNRNMNDIEEKRRKLEEDYNNNLNQIDMDSLKESRIIDQSISKLRSEIEGLKKSNKPILIIFIVDGSGSMGCRMGNLTRFEQVKRGFNKLIETRCHALSQDLVSIIIFESRVTFSKHKIDIKTRPTLPDPSWGGTIYESALNDLHENLKSCPNTHQPIVLFLTDGENGGNNTRAKELMKKISTDYLSKGLVMFGLGVGDDNFQLLQELSVLGNNGKSFIEVGDDTIDLFHNVKEESQIVEAFDKLIQVTNMASHIMNKQKMLTDLKNNILENTQVGKNFLSRSMTNSKDFLNECKQSRQSEQNRGEAHFDARISNLTKENKEMKDEICKIQSNITNMRNEIVNPKNASDECINKIKQCEEELLKLKLQVNEEKEILLKRIAESREQMFQSVTSKVDDLKKENFNLTELRLRCTAEAYHNYREELNEISEKATKFKEFIKNTHKCLVIYSNDVDEKIKNTRSFNENEIFDLLIIYFNKTVFTNENLPFGKDEENFEKILRHSISSQFLVENEDQFNKIMQIAPRSLIRRLMNNDFDGIVNEVRAKYSRLINDAENEINTINNELRNLRNPGNTHTEEEENPLDEEIRKLSTNKRQLERRENLESIFQTEYDDINEIGRQIERAKQDLKRNIEDENNKRQEVEDDFDDEIKEINSNNLMDSTSRRERIREIRREKTDALREIDNKIEKLGTTTEEKIQTLNKSKRDKNNELERNIENKIEKINEKIKNLRKEKQQDINKVRTEQQNKEDKKIDQINLLRLNIRKNTEAQENIRNVLSRIHSLITSILDKRERCLGFAIINKFLDLYDNNISGVLQIRNNENTKIKAIAK